MYQQSIDGFYPKARALRRVFDQRFKDPLRAQSDRFVWDYWHVPGQYTLLRTPASSYFPPQLYAAFHRHLVEWGRENLGCHDVSPPWLSCYVEGCRQELHSDLPHGPLAFVFSLTTHQAFKGGETFLLDERALATRAARERRHMVKVVAPKFNRLLVFNPAIPHGVNEVRGTHDPRHGRLVIHGWFVNPRPFWYGPLTAAQVSEGIERGLAAALNGRLELGHGLFSVRLWIAKSGEVKSLTPLVNTLVGEERRDFSVLLRALKALRFAKRRASTRLTLPLSMG